VQRLDEEPRDVGGVAKAELDGLGSAGTGAGVTGDGERDAVAVGLGDELGVGPAGAGDGVGGCSW
jgi:hypothetical protein